MNRWLFLRSAHKGEQLTAEAIPVLDPLTDMWTGLFAEVVVQSGGRGEVRVLGEPAELGGDALRFLRAGDFSHSIEKPDVIFARGGYLDYLPALRAWPDAVRVYYGAGKRYCPGDGIAYDVILVDTPAQKAVVSERHPDARVEVFHKPAALCFRPVPAEQRFDVVFNCHRQAEFKGYKWLIDRLPRCEVLRIGAPDPWFIGAVYAGNLHAVFTGNIQTSQIPAWACRAKVGVVCDDGTTDSGPRILPEYLAMGIPVLVRNTVRADLGAYVTPQTGRVGDDETFGDLLNDILRNGHGMDPRGYYDRHLSMPMAAAQIVRLVREAMEA